MGRSQVALHFKVRFRVYFLDNGNSTSSEFCAILPLPSSSCGITQDQANLVCFCAVPTRLSSTASLIWNHKEDDDIVWHRASLPSDLRQPAGTLALVDRRSPSTGSAASAGWPTGMPSPALPKLEPLRTVQITAEEAGDTPAQQRVADKAALKVDRKLVESQPCGQKLGETGQGQETLYKYSEFVAVPGVPECRVMISRRGNSQRTDPRWCGLH